MNNRLTSKSSAFYMDNATKSLLDLFIKSKPLIDHDGGRAMIIYWRG